MLDALGAEGTGSLIGGVGILLAPTPFIFYGHEWPIRERSKFAPTAMEADEEPGRQDEEAAVESGGHESGPDVKKVVT